MLLDALDNDVVGCKNKPKNAAQKKQINAALALLKIPGALFSRPVDAGDTIILKELEFETSKDHEDFHAS